MNGRGASTVSRGLRTPARARPRSWGSDQAAGRVLVVEVRALGNRNAAGPGHLVAGVLRFLYGNQWLLRSIT